MIADAALVVPSFGYRSATLPVFDAEGQRLLLNAELGGVAVGEHVACGWLMAGAWTTSSASASARATGSGSMGGEPNFVGQANSLWLYHNDIGAIIYRAIDGLSAPCSGYSCLSPP